MKKRLTIILLIFYIMTFTGCNKVEVLSQTVFGDGLVATYQEQRGGYLNKEGEVVIDFQYDKVYPFFYGVAIIVDDGLYYLINKNNDKLFTKGYFWIKKDLRENIYWFSENNKIGLMNNKGEKIIEAKYDMKSLCFFSNGLAAVYLDGYLGFINSSGKVVIDFDNHYQFKSLYVNGLAQVEKAGKVGFIDNEGNLVIDYQYDSATSFNEYNQSIVKKGDDYQVINKSGKVIIKQANDIFLMKNGYLVINEKNQYLYNKDGKIINTFSYDEIDTSKGYIKAIKNEVVEIKDNCFKTIYTTTNEKQFDVIISIDKKFYVASYHNGDIELNTDGYTYHLLGDQVYQIYKNKVVVIKDKKYGVIDLDNNIIIDYQYDFIQLFCDNFILVNNNYKYGVLDFKGHLIIPCEYQMFNTIYEGYDLYY